MGEERQKQLPAPILSDRMQDHVRFALIGMVHFLKVTAENHKANLAYATLRDPTGIKI